MIGGASSYTGGTPLINGGTGAYIGVLVDLDAGTLRSTLNCGTATSAGAMPASRPLYPSTMGQNSTKFTVNFGATPFHCTPPAGYKQGLWP